MAGDCSTIARCSPLVGHCPADKFLYKFENCDYKRRLDSGAVDPGIPPPAVNDFLRGHRVDGIRLVTYLDATSM